MFAVKGWSVSAEKLKPETEGALPKPGALEKKSRKRRRPANREEDVTNDNVANLWEEVIERKRPRMTGANGQTIGKRDRKPKAEAAAGDAEGAKTNETEKGHVKAAEAQPTPDGKHVSKLEKLKKKGKKEKKDKQKKDESFAAGAPGATSKSPAQDHIAKPAPLPAPPKLTPLQAAMREKLVSARFRHLNETLYTRPSAEAYRLFEDSPEMFQEYHEGFRRQVDVWPENPVDGYVRDVKLRGRQRWDASRDRRRGPPSRGQQQPQQQGGAGDGMVAPLPRTNGTCVIADLGCGDARLASELQAEGSKLRVEVRSFDLHNPSPLVTRADIANLPLEDGSVNVAVFCLALMGTNWLDFVEEAYRVLHWKGELWVAEIKSRFGHVGRAGGKKGGGAAGPVEHSVGNRRKVQAAGKKGKGTSKETDGTVDEAELAVEVDGVEDTRQQTDVSAFVEALKKRGFVLHGEGAEAVDMSNRMFVKMRFLKAAPAVKGKMAVKDGETARGMMPKKPKFIESEDGGADESSILKPCVYKLR
ncbi:25S rRNA (Adenine(645)-N(1))-methyltransferase [Pleurostoma richardsiae]|uniref:Ribosomal RNA-processing protein 8 n=1 Tax=Pleurostoma richardsiae TaxID=41990 RepID=A0AA38R354_9PEZI|nr:25S rRNA (Adenine(645)-N(1))-methyltransferase [Pleurostoma richardsiae]